MRTRHPLQTLVLGFAAILFASAVAAGEIRLFVAVPSFVVSIAPVDEESRAAENSILYQRTADESEWAALGVCRKLTLPNGDIRFTREVTVERDGLYQYTSRPVVAGDVASPPLQDAPAQAQVVVDTLPPVADLLSPAEGYATMPGEEVVLSWTAEDENLDEMPAVLSYTTDGGKSWNIIARDLPATGEQKWTVPVDGLPAVVRLAAADKAGNIGRSLKGIEQDAAAAVTPPDLPPLAATPRPAETTMDKREPAPPKTTDTLAGPNRSWLYYLMAVNLMKQNLPADALQYYWLAVKEDPDFINAWGDIALAYISLGAYNSAREVLEQTRDKAPERIELMHLMGESYQAEGMDLLKRANSADDRLKAKGMIDKAVEWYGLALEQAAKDWRVAEQAPSFYRLGEICYYVNMDRDGARAYWRKILELHTPTPNSDLIKWSAEQDREKALARHQKYTYQKVELTTWQNWARGYIEQLDERERKGILDLMPIQRITAAPSPTPLPYGQNAMNPGREDGRSLFSLPSQLGSPAPVPAATATSGRSARAGKAGISYAGQAAEDYSFYGDKNSTTRRDDARPAQASPRAGASAFTGGPDAPPPLPDPYAMSRPASRPGWAGVTPYGNRPSDDW